MVARAAGFQISDHEAEQEMEGHDLQGEQGLSERHVSSAKNVWRCPDWNPSQLVAHREHHLSHRPMTGTRSYELRTYGLFSSFYDFFSARHRGDLSLMNLWADSGLSLFSQCIEVMRATDGLRQFVLGLLECWWDTTNTFHFPWGEMTITPTDFSMLTSLSFTEKPVEVDTELRFGSPGVRDLLGPVVDILRPVAKFAEQKTLCRGMSMEGTATEQKVRLLLLIFISGYLVVDAGVSTRCYLRYLPSLAALGQVHECDWAGLSYAHLLISMRHACRLKSRTTNAACMGAWRVIEFWAYEYLPKLAPERSAPCGHPSIPSWAGRKPPEIQDALHKTRSAIRKMKRGSVNFRPWVGIEIPASVSYAMTLTQTRRIFWYLDEPVWYLGERVARQHSHDSFVVPVDPPGTMMNDDLKKALWKNRGTVANKVDWRELILLDQSYEEFVRSRLASPVKYCRVRDFAGGDIPHAELSVTHAGPTGPIQQTIPEPPEVELLSSGSLPDDFAGLTREGSVHVLRVLDGYRGYLRTLLTERAQWAQFRPPMYYPGPYYPPPFHYGMPAFRPHHSSGSNTMPSQFSQFAGALFSGSMTAPALFRGSMPANMASQMTGAQ